MRIRYSVFYTVLAVVFMLSAPGILQAQNEQIGKIDAASEALAQVMVSFRDNLPDSLKNEVHAVAVFPSTVRGGLFANTKYGEGVMVVRSGENDWSNPVFVTLEGESTAWQAGARTSDLLLLFTNEDAIENLKSGTLNLGSDTTVAAGPVGPSTGTSEAGNTGSQPEVYSYSISEGLFAGVDLGGSSLKVDEFTNSQFYDKSDIEIEAIISGKGIKESLAAKRFTCLVADYTGTKQVCA